jgi:polysaccharide biosynthesis protein PslG
MLSDLMSSRRGQTARRVVLALALAAMLLVSLVTGASASRHSRSTAGRLRARAPMFGVNMMSPGSFRSLGAIDQAMAQARALHAKIVRTSVPWSTVEPNGPEPSAAALPMIDRFVADANRDGIKVIMMADSTPCWASTAPAAIERRCASDGVAMAYPPRQASDYGSYVAFLAKRYASDLAAIEIWNEPDQRNEDYLAGTQKAAHYAAMLRAAYPAIKAVAPSVPVLAGSLVGSNGNFLRSLYAAGIRGYYDGLAVHFYTLTLADLRTFHEAQLASGDTTPLWLDEFGWSSCWPAHQVEQEQSCVTQAVQATNLRNTVRQIARLPYVTAAVSYMLRDVSGEEFGVVNPAGARKPSFAALAQGFASPFGPISPVTLKLRREGSHVQATGSGPVADYMRMEVYRRGVLRFISLFTLDRFNRYSIAIPASLGVNGLTARVYQYGQGSASAARATI